MCVVCFSGPAGQRGGVHVRQQPVRSAGVGGHHHQVRGLKGGGQLTCLLYNRYFRGKDCFSFRTFCHVICYKARLKNNELKCQFGLLQHCISNFWQNFGYWFEIISHIIKLNQNFAELLPKRTVLLKAANWTNPCRTNRFLCFQWFFCFYHRILILQKVYWWKEKCFILW